MPKVGGGGLPKESGPGLSHPLGGPVYITLFSHNLRGFLLIINFNGHS